MIFFFGTEIVYKESDVDEDEIGSRIRSIKYPLESSHICPIYPMIDRRRSAKTPVGEIRRKSEVEKESFFEYEANKNPCYKCPRRGDEEEPNIFGYRGRQELAPVLGDEECDQELEIIPSTIDEMSERESVEESNEDEDEDIPNNQII